MIAKEDLEARCREFQELEKRTSFYDMARELVDGGFRVHGAVLLLATWNIGRFRVVNKGEIAVELNKAFQECSENFCILKKERLETVDLNSSATDIKKIYERLSKIRGVEYTGTTKVMSINNPALFVMWDGCIRGEYRYGVSSEEYLRFMKEMKNMFSGIKWQDKKPLAKAIDEYNYITISFPRINSQRRKK